MTTEPEAIPADVLDTAQRFACASAPPVDGAEAKPVAWQRLCSDGTWSDDISREEGVQDSWKSWGFESRPLYTHPAPASPDAEMVRCRKIVRDYLDAEFFHYDGVNAALDGIPFAHVAHVIRVFQHRIDDVLSQHEGPRS